MNMEKDLSILVVHYYAEECLPDLIGSMENFLSGLRAEILIWDNGSRNGQPALPTLKCPIRWHSSPQNVGFASGHIALAEKAFGERFLIVNPDARFAAGGLERLWKTAEENPRAGVVVPKILYPDGRLQISVFPSAAFYFDLFDSFWLGQPLPFGPRRQLWARLKNDREPFPVGWASGACLLVRREVWEKTGGFDPQFFFGGEDVDFCRRVWKAGFEIICEPRALLLHQGGQSLQKEFENRIFYYYQKRMYFARKHFSRLQYAISYLVSFFELVLKWLAGLVLGIFKPEWRAKRRGYAKTLSVLVSPQFNQPDEWITRWTQQKRAKAGLPL